MEFQALVAAFGLQINADEEIESPASLSAATLAFLHAVDKEKGRLSALQKIIASRAIQWAHSAEASAITEQRVGWLEATLVPLLAGAPSDVTATITAALQHVPSSMGAYTDVQVRACSTLITALRGLRSKNIEPAVSAE